MTESSKAGVFLRIIVAALLGLLAISIFWPVRSGRGPSHRTDSANNLRQISIAMMAYEERTLGPLRICCPNRPGDPLVSWRVRLVRELGGADLHDTYHFDQPWDHNINEPATKTLLRTYRDPRSYDDNRTAYLAVTGPGTFFGDGQSRNSNRKINTPEEVILFVEVDEDHMVPWAKPEDWQFDPKNPTAGLGERYDGEFNALFADGHVASISIDTDPAKLRRMFAPYLQQ